MELALQSDLNLGVSRRLVTNGLLNHQSYSTSGGREVNWPLLVLPIFVDTALQIKILERLQVDGERPVRAPAV